MMPYIENGVAVHFPDDNYFFLSSCASYKTLSPFSVKEMDVCWLDRNKNILWLVELKAFDHVDNINFKATDISDGDVVSYWINELYLKSLHTLTMLETKRSGTQKCLVEGIETTTTFRLVYLINVIPGQEEYLSYWKDKLESLLLPYLKIFNVDSLAVVPYRTAKEKKTLPWIV